jgi:hypothetical protein
MTWLSIIYELLLALAKDIFAICIKYLSVKWSSLKILAKLQQFEIKRTLFRKFYERKRN